MNENARRIFAAAYETLDRVRDIEVTPRAYHGDDGMLTSWSRGMPPKPAPPPLLTATDVEQKIRDALPGVATVIHEVRQQLRSEFAAEIAKLELRVDTLVHEETKRIEAAERRERGDVVEVIPQFLQRRRHDAA